MAIKGKWGVGKTFYWSRVVDEELNEPRERARGGGLRNLFGRSADKEDPVPKARKGYAYVSLFGLNSIEELKDALVTAIATRKVRGTSRAAAVAREAVPELTEAAKKLLEALPGVGPAATSLGKSMAFRLVNDALVCFDDLERRGEGLRIEDVFGLVTQLREERDCDVVVILNDGALEEDDKLAYERHGEKAIDIHVAFEPTPEESVEIGLPRDLGRREEVAALCLKLGITNVRLLQRIAQKVSQLDSYLTGRSGLAQESAIKSLVFLTWAYYNSEEGALPFEVARSRFDPLGYALMGERLTPEQKALEAVALAYGYHIGSTLDDAIAEFVEDGYPHPQRLRKGLDELDREEDRGERARTLREAWDLYALSFSNNEDLFVEALNETFRESVDDRNATDLQSALSVLRALGRDAVANGIADLYLERHRDSILHQSPVDFEQLVNDEYLSARLAEIRREPPAEADLVAAFIRLGRERVVSRADMNALAAASPYDIRDALRQIEGEGVVDSVRRALEFGDGQGGTSISDKVRAALGHLATEHRMNEVRIRNLYRVEPMYGPMPG